MEELGSMWSYQEGIDELNQKLLYTTIELESVKMEATEVMRKHREDIKHLLNLLKIAYEERDEARDQLQKLLNKFMPSSPTELPTILPFVQQESSLVVIPKKANSSITESNSLSHGSSPVESLFDAVTSPDISNVNMADSSQMGFVNQSFVQEYTGSMSTGLVSSKMTNTDPATAVIDNLVKGKSLPQKGKLLQAVMDAGPLLQTLLVAGPLPQWRNPPPLQAFKIPPVSIKGCEDANVNHKPAANASVAVPKLLSSANIALKTAANPSCAVSKPLNSFLEMSRGSSQMCSASMLNFTCGPSGSGLSNERLLTPAASFNTQIPTGKRQRF